MTWLVIACYIGTAYLAPALFLTALARLAGLPWSLSVLVGITWGPVLIGILIDARKK